MMARPKTHLLTGVGALAVFLAGCGGGGGGDVAAGANPGTGTTTSPVTPAAPATPATPDPAPAPILDSFGQVVTGMAPGDSGIDGTAASGAPLVGVQVVITDAAGKTSSAVTDSQGYYRANVTGFTVPLVAKVFADTKTAHSLSNQPLKANGFVTLNISGLTDKVASDVARTGGKPTAAGLTARIVADHPGATADSIARMRIDIAAVLTAAGMNASTFNPIDVPFRPDHTGYDFVIDNVARTFDIDGATLLSLGPTFTLPGRWRLVIAPFATLADLPGSEVPKDAVTAANWCKSGYAPAVLSGAIGDMGACSNNTTIEPYPSAGTTATVSTTGTLQSFEGCGACEVGSKVVMNYVIAKTVTPKQTDPFWIGPSGSVGTFTHTRIK